MAAGAIPVIVTGDAEHRPYIRPFEELIPWHDISLHLPWRDIKRIPDMLASLSDDRIQQQMQRGVRRAWREQMRANAWPLAVHRLVEARVRREAR